jgi:hypothetical protein
MQGNRTGYQFDVSTRQQRAVLHERQLGGQFCLILAMKLKLMKRALAMIAGRMQRT